ncbi:MAG: hypothetical protein Q9209_007896 [Squamulea sp. 1 TL-2023]
MDDPIEIIHHSTPPTAAKADKLEHNQYEPTTDPLAATEPRSRVWLAAILLALSLSLFISKLLPAITGYVVLTYSQVQADAPLRAKSALGQTLRHFGTQVDSTSSSDHVRT